MQELYTFKIQGQSDVRYTSSNSSVTAGGFVYFPATITRTEVQAEANDFVSRVQIRMPRTDVIASAVQQGRVEVFIQQYDGSTLSTLWQGYIIGTTWDNDEATLSCEDNLAPVQQLAGSQRFSRECRHTLYSPQCGADIVDFRIVAAILDVNPEARTLKVRINNTTLPTWDFDGGVLIGPNGKMYQIAHATDKTTPGVYSEYSLVMGGRDAVPTGSGFIAPGCNRGRQRCNDRFSNIENFGGFAYLNKSNLLDKRTTTYSKK